jgi:chromosome partitioning protein
VRSTTEYALAAPKYRSHCDNAVCRKTIQSLHFAGFSVFWRKWNDPPLSPWSASLAPRVLFFVEYDLLVFRLAYRWERRTMKTLLIAAEKGGTGKTALLCQFAHYLRGVRGARVLVIDLAQPACSTASLARACGGAVLGSERTIAIPPVQSQGTRTPHIQILPGRAIHGLSLEAGESSARYYANMRHLLDVVAPFADVCLIDCPPLPDPRAVCAEANVDAMLSPILLSSEAFDSAHDLINGVQGVRNVRARLNPALRFFGLLPNMVEHTPLQQAQSRALQAHLSAWLMPDPRDPFGYLHIPRLDAIAQAQAEGVSVRDLGRTDETARRAWALMRACFDVLARRLDWVQPCEPGTGAGGAPGAKADHTEAAHE